MASSAQFIPFLLNTPFLFPTEGTIETFGDSSILWRNKARVPTCSPKFRLPNCKNGDVYCKLILEQNQISIENVSQEIGSIIISGHICLQNAADIDIVEKEVKNKACFPVNLASLLYCAYNTIQNVHIIKLSVSGATLSVKTSNPVAALEKKTCTKTFLCNMERLLTTGDYADVEIHCKDGKVVKCHKNLLAARSPVLKTMLDSDFKEGNTGEIKLDYMEMDIVKDLLSFIYSGNLKDHKNAMDLLAAADQYQIQDLKETCAEILAAEMTVDNVLEILVAADRYRIAELKQSAMAMVVLNAKTLVNTPKFNEFCTKCVDKQLVIDIVKAQANK